MRINSQPYRPRILSTVLAKALESMPVVVLGGARQTGKSRIVQQLGGTGRVYCTLDDLEVRDAAAREPRLLLDQAEQLTIDEVQRVPSLLIAIKQDIDRARRPGRFILTGSANLLLMHQVSESLAGRALHLGLWPMTAREILGQGVGGVWTSLFEQSRADWRSLIEGRDPIGSSWQERARIGGYPTPALELRDTAARTLWFQGYVQTYVERDLRQLAQVENLADFRRLMQALALRIGTQVNLSTVGTGLTLSRSTVHRWVNLLETSYLLVRIPTYSVNRGKRLTKSPKWYWSDPGLALHLAGDPEPSGAHLENLILGDLLAWRDATFPSPQVLHWRSVDRHEVDFILEWRGKLIPVEVKASARPGPAESRGIRLFMDLHRDQVIGGLVLHTGTECYPVMDGLLAAPIDRVL